MRPTQLPPPHRIPIVGAPAVRHQDAPKRLAQQVARHLAAPGQAHQKDRHPRGRGHPQPGPFASFTPARLVQVRARLLLDVGACLLHRRRNGLRRGHLQVAHRPQTHRQRKQVVEHPLGGALRQTIRPSTQRGYRLGTWAIHPRRYPCRPCRLGHVATGWADEPMHLVLRDHRSYRRDLKHLMPLRLRVVTV